MRPVRRAADLLPDALTRDAATPLVTWYDDALGARVELSGATLDNWVAKVAGLLVEELGLQPGATLALGAAGHWLAVPVLLAGFATGLVVDVTGDPPGGSDVALVEPAGARAALDAGVGEVLVVPETALPRPLTGLPAGAFDLAVEAAGQADRFVAPFAVPPDAPALTTAEGTASQQEVAARAAAAGAPPGVRLLTTLPLQRWSGAGQGLLVPLAVGGSTVLWARPDLDRLARLVADERVDAALGPVGSQEPPVPWWGAG